MKKVKAIILALMMVISLVACGSSGGSENRNQGTGNAVSSAQGNNAVNDQAATSGEDENNTSENDGTAGSGSNILVAYFTAAENSGVDAVSSASVTTVDGEPYGVSQAVANMIAAETGGDLFSIQTSVIYPAEFDPLADYAAEEQEAGTLPELTTHIENLDDYDTIFVGFPIWWYDMPQIMYAFFDEYDFSGKTIIPFTVHNGSRLSGTPAKIQELEPDATVIQDGFTVSHQNASDSAADVKVWLEGLGI